MIEADKRKAVFLLHQEGMGGREIARRLNVSRNTVDTIIKQGGVMPEVQRTRQVIEEQLLRRLYAECDGFAQRIHERLTEEEGLELKYSTLTRMLRELGISKPSKARCDRVPDEPGAEMQHDTTINTFERIIALNVTQGERTLPSVEIDEDFKKRDSYQQGRLTDPPDLSNYDDEPENNHE